MVSYKHFVGRICGTGVREEMRMVRERLGVPYRFLQPPYLPPDTNYIEP